MMRKASTADYSHMSNAKIKLALMMGSWGKGTNAPHPGPLTPAERKALAEELRRRQERANPPGESARPA